MTTTVQDNRAKELLADIQTEFQPQNQKTIPADNRRQSPRHALMRKVIAMGATQDGCLFEADRIEGQTWNVSKGGLSLELAGRSQIDKGPLLVGIAGPDQSMLYAGVLVRHVKCADTNAVQLGVEFAGPACDVLSPSNLAPTFNTERSTFDFPLSQRVYDSWERAGILQRFLADRVQVCPRCGAIPTLREGCPECLGARGSCDKLIHHFPCAHVAAVHDFESTGGITCPKCRMKDLVVGADFEFLSGPYNCVDCGKSSTTLEGIAHCMQCHHRCPTQHLSQVDIWAYHARRFDPLDFIPQ